MLAVDREWQGKGAGFALKLAQRAVAIDRGIGLVRWTFDPLLTRNAHFNLAKLGAYADGFRRNFYGAMDDDLNRGERSDRLVIRWELDRDPEPGVVPDEGTVVLDRDGAEDRPEPLIASDPADAGAGPLLIRIPEDYRALKEADPELAQRWREAVGATLGPLLDHGKVVRGLHRPRDLRPRLIGSVHEPHPRHRAADDRSARSSGRSGRASARRPARNASSFASSPTRRSAGGSAWPASSRLLRGVQRGSVADAAGPPRTGAARRRSQARRRRPAHGVGSRASDGEGRPGDGGAGCVAARARAFARRPPWRGSRACRVRCVGRDHADHRRAPRPGRRVPRRGLPADQAEDRTGDRRRARRGGARSASRHQALGRRERRVHDRTGERPARARAVRPADDRAAALARGSGGAREAAAHASDTGLPRRVDPFGGRRGSGARARRVSHHQHQARPRGGTARGPAHPRPRPGAGRARLVRRHARDRHRPRREPRARRPPRIHAPGGHLREPSLLRRGRHRALRARRRRDDGRADRTRVWASSRSTDVWTRSPPASNASDPPRSEAVTASPRRLPVGEIRGPGPSEMRDTGQMRRIPSMPGADRATHRASDKEVPTRWTTNDHPLVAGQERRRPRAPTRRFTRRRRRQRRVATGRSAAHRSGHVVRRRTGDAREEEAGNVRSDRAVDRSGGRGRRGRGDRDHDVRAARSRREPWRPRFRPRPTCSAPCTWIRRRARRSTSSGSPRSSPRSATSSSCGTRSTRCSTRLSHRRISPPKTSSGGSARRSDSRARSTPRGSCHRARS